jgi:hypothetical protein
MKSRFDNSLDLIFLGTLCANPPGSFMFQTGHSVVDEMISPENNSGPTGVQILSDASIGKTLVRQKANARSQHDFLRRRWRSDPVLKLILLFKIHGKALGRLPHAPKIVENGQL